MKKVICQIFSNVNLRVTIRANIKNVDFLGVELNLNNGTFSPFMKPNNKPLYVHSSSNHPKSILKNIPLSVNKRLSSISSNEDIFKKAIPPYQEALEKSGYQHKLYFDPPCHPKQKKTRSRNVTYFNPPFSETVKTYVGHIFLKLIDTSITSENPLRKIFNRNTIKLSYKCMPNMGQAISRHNSKLLNKADPQPEPGCNCRAGVDNCPFNGQCQMDNVIYRAAVTTEDGKSESYTGLTSTTFKQRYGGHKTSLNNAKYQNKSTLSTHVWKLKSENKKFSIKWGPLDRAPNFNPSTRKCRLCLKEKWYILYKPETATLNKRTEFYTACRHRLKGLLASS